MPEIANCTMQGRMSVFCPKNCKKCRLGVDNGPGLRYNNRRRREQHPGTPHGVCGRSSSGRAPPCQGGGSEFEPRRPLHLCGSLAQLGEHLPYKQRVSGSSPLTSTTKTTHESEWFFFLSLETVGFPGHTRRAALRSVRAAPFPARIDRGT